ncbi:MAG: alpha-glucan family phosphorylase, partial [Zetaproteobacteria bacterium]
LALYHGVLSEFYAYHSERDYSWFQQHHAEAGLHVAYFCAEFGLHEALPIYSGGLGILAGDHLKSASDSGVPLTGVGLLYRHGYFQQRINAEGAQEEFYPKVAFEDLPIAPILDPKGAPILVRVPIAEHELALKLWQARVGHVRLVLLDADIDENPPELRGITYELYGGDRENRIRQELCLGVGGVRALEALGIRPSCWHLNEGHAAFAAIERICAHVERNGLSLDEALEAVAADTVFTTHTPVPAGHDVFDEGLAGRYLAPFAQRIGLPVEKLLALGRGDLGLGAEGFNMSVLAIRTSHRVNGVSRLHREVTAHMCRAMWPEVPAEENPVDSVTNGVHALSWLAPEWTDLFDRLWGGVWRGRLHDPDYWARIEAIPDHLFWSTHLTNKERLLAHARAILEAQARRNGESPQLVAEMTKFFDTRTMIIGFARRFATYKRATLLMQDEAKLKALIDAAPGPVVFLFAGKAHPADGPGKAMIRRLHELARDPRFLGHIVMLEGYDMSLARHMVAGCDLWLNTPRRPMEASGTSGMKAAINGVPNLSVLDGWWPEGFDGTNGWAIGAETPVPDPQPPEARDRQDAEALRHALQWEVFPSFFQRDEAGLPRGWLGVAKRAMRTIIPRFNSDRMLIEYTERFYLPAHQAGAALAENGFAEAKALAAWKARVRAAWPEVRLAWEAPSEGPILRHFGESLTVRLRAELAGLAPEEVAVEAVLELADLNGRRTRSVIPLEHIGDGVFAAEIAPPEAGEYQLRARIYPRHPRLAHPLAMGLMREI